MRNLVLAVVVALALPLVGGAKSVKDQCRDRCRTQYDFCLKRSSTSKGKSQCKVELKNCRGSCGR